MLHLTQALRRFDDCHLLNLAITVSTGLRAQQSVASALPTSAVS